MNTPEIVEGILREAMTAARARGVQIAQGVDRFVEERNGVTCACAMGCAILEVPFRRPQSAVKDRLWIGDAQIAAIAGGFDGDCFSEADYCLEKEPWWDLGERLWREFGTAPAVATTNVEGIES